MSESIAWDDADGIRAPTRSPLAWIRHLRRRHTGAPMPEPEVHFRSTRYEASCLPQDDINNYLYAITLTRSRGGLWAVEHGSYCLGLDEGIHERRPSCFLRHRYDLETARAIADEAAPGITVMGHTVADALARSQEADR